MDQTYGQGWKLTTNTVNSFNCSCPVSKSTALVIDYRSPQRRRDRVDSSRRSRDRRDRRGHSRDRDGRRYRFIITS